MAVAEHIKQGIRSGRIFMPIEKKGFEGKKKEINQVKGGYKSKKNQFQNYNTPSPLSQIININFNSSFPAKKFEPQNN